MPCLSAFFRLKSLREPRAARRVGDAADMRAEERRAAAIAEGPLFRSFGRRRGRVAWELQARRIDGCNVARILQRAMADAGLDGNFGTHRLRAGLVTAGAVASVVDRDCICVARHRSVATLHGYIRRATVFEDPPLATILGGTAPSLRRE